MSVMVEWRNRLIQVYNGIKKICGNFSHGNRGHSHSHLRSFPLFSNPHSRVGSLIPNSMGFPWDSKLEYQSHGHLCYAQRRGLKS